MNYEAHPLADAFPLMNRDEFKNLVASIKQHGLLDPVVRRNLLIIDGRNRLRACAEAGVEPRFVEYDSEMPVGEYIWAKNVDRRQLSPDHRASVVMKWQQYEREQATARQELSEGRGKKGMSKSTDLLRDRGTQRDALAKRADVTVYKIQQATAVKKYDEEQGTEMLEEVKRGEMQLRDAAHEAGFTGHSTDPKTRKAGRALRRTISPWKFDKQLQRAKVFLEGHIRAAPKNRRREYRDAVVDIVKGA